MLTWKAKTLLRCVMLIVLAGCSGESDKPCGEADAISPCPPSNSLSEIEGMMDALELSLSRFEINTYANLLAEEFVFVHEPGYFDTTKTFWTKSQDSLAVKKLFDAPGLTAIRPRFVYAVSGDSVQTCVSGVFATRVHVYDTFLDIDFDGGETTIRVDGDIQVLFFRRGEAPREDPDRWFIIEWQDLGHTSGAPSPSCVIESWSITMVKELFL